MEYPVHSSDCSSCTFHAVKPHPALLHPQKPLEAKETHAQERFQSERCCVWAAAAIVYSRKDGSPKKTTALNCDLPLSQVMWWYNFF